MIHESTVDRKSARIERRPLPRLRIVRKSNEPESSGARALIQRLGNQGTQRLVRGLSSDSSEAAPLRPSSIQAKLTIGEPGDAHEQEAERVARAVMRKSAADVQGMPVASASAGRSTFNAQVPCAECEEEIGKKPGAQVQRREHAAGAQLVGPSTAANIEALRGVSHALQTNEGQELIAHELTHVVQQSALAHQAQPISMESPNGDKFEKEAQFQAKRLIHGRTKGAIPIQLGPRQPILQRKSDISKAPSSLPCLKETGPGHPLGLNYKFAQSKAELSPANRADIAEIVRVDYAKYGVPVKEYVHGFASVEGTQEFNWQLSCARAEAIKAELVRNGVPADKIATIAHGESTEFSATKLSENRRAIIGNLPVDQHQPAPAPPTPKPTTTPTKSYTFDMTINGCDSRPFVQRTVVNAVMAAYAKVITSGCIKSESLKEKILSEFDGLNVECEQDGDDCGMASRYFTQTVNLYPKALDPNRCGPLEATILHEIVHLTEWLPTGTWNPFGHGILPDACEKSCFGVGSGDASKCK